MSNKSTRTEEELDFIDNVVSGLTPVDALKESFDLDENMTPDQIKLYARETVLRLGSQIHERRNKLRKAGLLPEMANLQCTEKQLTFVFEYLRLSGKANRLINSYIIAYDTSGMTPFTINSKAGTLLKHPKVQNALKQYRKNLEEEFSYSLGEYIRELNENRDKAEKLGQVSAMNAATLEKGKVFGYDKHTSKDVGSKDNPFNLAVNMPIEDLIEICLNENIPPEPENNQ